MSQITLEIDNSIDLELLLSLAKRLDIKVVSTKCTTEPANTNYVTPEFTVDMMEAWQDEMPEEQTSSMNDEAFYQAVQEIS